jgi:hypothetical protein
MKRHLKKFRRPGNLVHHISYIGFEIHGYENLYLLLGYDTKRNRDLLSYAKLSYNIWNFQDAGYFYCSILLRTQTQFGALKC